MTKPSKLSLMLLCALITAVLLLSGSPAISQRQTPGERLRGSSGDEQPPDPYADMSVLVEAFVVEVKLPALYQMDVSPLGAESHAVSVADILACLKDPQKATVVTGVKTLGTHQFRGGTTSQQETRYVRQTRTRPTNQGSDRSVNYVPYQNGQKFSAAPSILSAEEVFVNYSFSYSGFLSQPETGDEVPFDTASWEWSGTAALNAGEPTIVGATQDQTRAFFLILTAHIAPEAGR